MSDDYINKQLEKAVRNKDIENVRALLRAGADPNFQPDNKSAARHEYGNKLLHCTNNAEIANELLLHGAHVDWTNSSNRTPLFFAITEGRSEKLVRVLLKHGADVNTQDRKCNTPLNIAVKNDYIDLEVIRALLEHGADINIRNRECRAFEQYHTPLDNALRCTKVAELFIKITLIKNFDKDYAKIIDLNPYRELSCYSTLSSYLDKCVREITKMKTDCISNNISLYEFVASKEVNKDVLYVNDGIVRSIRNRVLQVLDYVNYSIYHDIIYAKIGPGLERASLLDKISEIEVYTKSDTSNEAQGVERKTVVLNYYTKHEVAQYLFNNDLLNFVVAFYRSTDKPSCVDKNITESSSQYNTTLIEASTSNYKRAKLE